MCSEIELLSFCFYAYLYFIMNMYYFYKKTPSNYYFTNLGNGSRKSRGLSGSGVRRGV